MTNQELIIADYPILDVLNLVKKDKIGVYNATEILQRRLEIIPYNEHKKTYAPAWAYSFVTPSTVIYGPEEMILSSDKMFIPDIKKIREELSDRIESNLEEKSKNVAGNAKDFWFYQNHFSLTKEEFDNLYSLAKKLQEDNPGIARIVGFEELKFNVFRDIVYSANHHLLLFLFSTIKKAEEYHKICDDSAKGVDIILNKDILGKFIGGSFITLGGVGNGKNYPNIHFTTQGLCMGGQDISLTDRANFVLK